MEEYDNIIKMKLTSKALWKKYELEFLVPLQHGYALF